MSQTKQKRTPMPLVRALKIKLNLIKGTTVCKLLEVYNRHYVVQKYLKQQSAVLKLWWCNPKDYDITPKTPARKIFGNQVKIGNGAFRPTLVDIIMGRAIKTYF